MTVRVARALWIIRRPERVWVTATDGDHRKLVSRTALLRGAFSKGLVRL